MDLQNKKIAVLVSGGVDSSVALLKLKKLGLDVTAFYLKIWLEDELSHLSDCPWREDLKYVEGVCKKLEVPLEILNFQKEYFDKVVSYTIAEIKAGRTPNPDVMCNNNIKFGLFFDKITNDYDYVASGHYANTGVRNGVKTLKIAADDFKDQTYFLANLKDQQLAKIIFPLGDMPKSEVRKMAQLADLPNADRKDSQGICFLGKFKFNEFIGHYLKPQKGSIIDFDTKETLGEHQGYFFHTIGQRKGLGLSGGPYYVVAKDHKDNIVFVSKNYHSPDKLRNEFIANNLNIFGEIELPKDVKVKIRHGKDYHEAQVKYLSTDSVQVSLQESDQGIAPGQFVVFYQDEYCLGSAIIESET